jgi:hypothetical protein
LCRQNRIHEIKFPISFQLGCQSQIIENQLFI